MVMGRDERLKMEGLLKRFRESNAPLPGNMAVFLSEGGEILYAGIITDWPMIVTTDIEFGAVKELDSSKAPFAGKSVKYFTLITGH